MALLVGFMIGLGLLSLEFEFVWTMDFPSLVSRAPIIGLVIDLLGVCFSVFSLLLLPLLFYLTILILFESLFRTLYLAFNFPLAVNFSGKQYFEVLGKFEVVIF